MEILASAQYQDTQVRQKNIIWSCGRTDLLTREWGGDSLVREQQGGIFVPGWKGWAGLGIGLKQGKIQDLLYKGNKAQLAPDKVWPLNSDSGGTNDNVPKNFLNFSRPVFRMRLKGIHNNGYGYFNGQTLLVISLSGKLFFTIFCSPTTTN